MESYNNRDKMNVREFQDMRVEGFQELKNIYFLISNLLSINYKTYGLARFH